MFRCLKPQKVPLPKDIMGVSPETGKETPQALESGDPAGRKRRKNLG